MDGPMLENDAGVTLNHMLHFAIQQSQVKPLFLILRTEQIHHTLNVFNSIKTTLDLHVKLNLMVLLIFLVLIIMKNHGKLSLKWFTKKCSSNRLMQSYSNHPNHVNVNIIKQ